MISEKIERKILKIFNALIEKEKNIYISRKLLLESLGFNSFQLFSYLDIKKDVI